MVADSRAKRFYSQVAHVQILLFLLDGNNYLFGYKHSDGDLVDNDCPDMFNSNCEGIMVTTEIGGHRVEMYDAIDELPIVRFHKYQKLLLLDAGIGGDIAAFDQRIEKTRRFLMAGKTDKAQKELENLRHCVFLMQKGISPQHRALAVLITKIDGVEYNDISDDGLTKVLEILQDTPVKRLNDRLEAVKKKIDTDLMLYFPSIFNDSSVKEYYDILKKRTMAVLQNIIEGKQKPDGTREIDRLTTELLTYSKPQSFSGPEGVEVQFDRQFENLCLALSEQLHIKPKDCSVLEFYNAFDFLQERARAAEKGNKRPVGRR